MTASARGIAPRPHRVAMLELNDRLAKQQAMRAKFGRTLDRSGPIVGDGRGLKLGRYRKLSCGAFCGMRGGFGRQLSSSHRFSVAGSRGCGARLSGRRCVPRLVRTRLRELWIWLGCRGLFRDSSMPPQRLASEVLLPLAFRVRLMFPAPPGGESRSAGSDREQLVKWRNLVRVSSLRTSIIQRVKTHTRSPDFVFAAALRV